MEDEKHIRTQFRLVDSEKVHERPGDDAVR